MIILTQYSITVKTDSRQRIYNGTSTRNPLIRGKHYLFYGMYKSIKCEN